MGGAYARAPDRRRAETAHAPRRAPILRPMRRGVPPLGPAALAVPACAGGAGGASAVEAALRQALTSRSAESACEGLSARLVARIYGDRGRCRRIEGANLKD